MGASDVIVGTVLATGGEGLPDAADFAVRLQLKELKAPASRGVRTLTAHWAGGGAFVDFSPSPYASLVIDALGQEFVIRSVRPHAMGPGVLALIIESAESLGATVLSPTARMTALVGDEPAATDLLPVPLTLASPTARRAPAPLAKPPAPAPGADAKDIRCPHCGVVILKKERHRADAERGGAPVYCPRCGERTREPGSTGKFPLPPKPGKR